MKKKIKLLKNFFFLVFITNIILFYGQDSYNKDNKINEMNLPQSKLKSAKMGIFTDSTVAEADTWVESGNSLINFGDYTWIYVGYPGGGYGYDEALLRFNFTDKPSSYLNACISVNFGGVDKTYNFPIFLIEENWDENVVTWSNKPAYGILITTLTVSTNGIYKINITKYVEGRTNISIYISYDNAVNDNIWISPSKEGSSSNPEDYPQIIWTYEQELGYDIINPKNGDNLNYGNHLINWISIGGGSNVFIKLFNNSVFIENITDKIENDGMFNWYISPSANYSGNKYQIEIIDFYDQEICNLSEYFEISISVISTSGGGGGNNDDKDNNNNFIPYGNFYLLFLILAIFSVIIKGKSKLTLKKKN